MFRTDRLCSCGQEVRYIIDYYEEGKSNPEIGTKRKSPVMHGLFYRLLCASYFILVLIL